MQRQHRPAISVIVPVYKAENTIHRCVDSLLNQTLRDIEIILVDDGSPDNSGHVIDEYAKKDPRIKALHEQNSGVGTARNLGMSTATGEYIGFVDSDDWVLPHMYEILVSNSEKTRSDITFTGVRDVRFGRVVGGFEQTQETVTFSDETQLYAYRRHLFGQGIEKNEPYMPGYAVTGCYRRQFLNDWNLRFTNQMMEDMLFVLEACQRAKRITLVPGRPYCYRRFEQSSRMTTFRPRTMQDFRQHLLYTKELIKREPVQFQEESKVRLNRQVIDSYRSLTHLIEASAFPQKEKRKYVEELFSDPLLSGACSHYDPRSFRLFDRLFFYCEKRHLITPARIMMNVWIRISPFVRQVQWSIQSH